MTQARTSRARLVVAAALASVVAACSGQPAEVQPAVWRLQEPVSDSATSLPIGVLGGGCHADEEEVDRVEVDESDSRVVIAAFIRKPPTPAGQPCPAVGIEHSVTVDLDQPLGSRELVDPACDEVQSHSACRESKRLDGDA